MDVFCSKQSIALTVIFSYLISLPNGENQAVSSQPELQKFLILNKMIYQSFNLNETFWLWYIYYVFKCDLCLADAHNLNHATEKLKLNRRNSYSKTSKTSEKTEKSFTKCCFWKKECKIQYANRRIRRQWCIKFSSRVLTHKNVPIIKSRTYRTEYSKIHTEENISKSEIITKSKSKSNSKSKIISSDVNNPKESTAIVGKEHSSCNKECSESEFRKRSLVGKIIF